jgi:hypothetical protein
MRVFTLAFEFVLHSFLNSSDTTSMLSPFNSISCKLSKAKGTTINSEKVIERLNTEQIQLIFGSEWFRIEDVEIEKYTNCFSFRLNLKKKLKKLQKFFQIKKIIKR